MSGSTKQADQDIKNLAADYGLTNINSPQAGRRAAPTLPQNLIPFRTPSGLTGQIDRVANGGVTCLTTGQMAKISSRDVSRRGRQSALTISTDKGKATTLTGDGPTPEVQASWLPKGGIKEAVEKLK
jgi:hypothetical protein